MSWANDLPAWFVRFIGIAEILGALGLILPGFIDFGAAVATFMALSDPKPLLGIHLSNLELAPYTGPGLRPLSEAERVYLGQYQHWSEVDGGYKEASMSGLNNWNSQIIEEFRTNAGKIGEQLASSPINRVRTLSKLRQREREYGISKTGFRSFFNSFT